MDELETGKDKVKRICEILKNETLEPARFEAQKIIEEAQEEAHTIIRNAEKKAEDLLKSAGERIEQEKKLFQSSLSQAWKQSKEALKQQIENKLFNDELVSHVEKQTQDPKVIEKFITALVEAIEKEGTSADFSALGPSKVPVEKINALFAQNILQKLKEKGVIVGDFAGGAQLKLHDKKLTLDLTDKAIEELLARYLRKDFRELLFGP